MVGGGVAAGGVLLLEDERRRRDPHGRPAGAAGAPGARATRASTPAEIYKRDAPGVVFITAEVVQQSRRRSTLPTEQRGQRPAPGFVIDDRGSILTNAHVVDASPASASGSTTTRSSPAKIRGRDRSTDLAVLQVDPKGLVLAR